MAVRMRVALTAVYLLATPVLADDIGQDIVDMCQLQGSLGTAVVERCVELELQARASVEAADPVTAEVCTKELLDYGWRRVALCIEADRAEAQAAALVPIMKPSRLLPEDQRILAQLRANRYLRERQHESARNPCSDGMC